MKTNPMANTDNTKVIADKLIKVKAGESCTLFADIVGPLIVASGLTLTVTNQDQEIVYIGNLRTGDVKHVRQTAAEQHKADNIFSVFDAKPGTMSPHIVVTLPAKFTGCHSLGAYIYEIRHKAIMGDKITTLKEGYVEVVS